jgi:hypothetical protein
LYFYCWDGLKKGCENFDGIIAKVREERKWSTGELTDNPLKVGVCVKLRVLMEMESKLKRRMMH